MVVGYAPILYDCTNIVTSIIITTYLPWKCHVGQSQPQVYFLSEKPSTFDLYYTYNINKSLCYGTYQDLGHVSHFRNMSLGEFHSAYLHNVLYIVVSCKLFCCIFDYFAMFKAL